MSKHHNLLLLCAIIFFTHTYAQEEGQTTNTAMVAATSTSFFSTIQTGSPMQNGDPSAGDAASSGDTNSSAGAEGNDTGSFGTLSKGGLIAIVVVVSCVVIFGIVSSVLFYLAKKRSWEVRASIRKSAKRVATALTPRRSQFPKGVMDTGKGGRSSRGRTRIDDVPPTPRLNSHDLEKGRTKMSTFEMREPKVASKWPMRTNRS